MVRVYADMVADLFHHGHMLFLQHARALGDFLVVGIHADDVVMSYKRRPILTMEERVSAVRGCRYVDEVVPNAPLVVDRAWIERHRIDLVVHGDDFDEDALDRFYQAPREMGIFRTVPYTHGISTTEIIERITRADAQHRL